jgi:hypothetical protein
MEKTNQIPALTRRNLTEPSSSVTNLTKATHYVARARTLVFFFCMEIIINMEVKIAISKRRAVLWAVDQL